MFPGFRGARWLEFMPRRIGRWLGDVKDPAGRPGRIGFPQPCGRWLRTDLFLGGTTSFSGSAGPLGRGDSASSSANQRRAA